MNNIHISKKLPVDTPLVCITVYEREGIMCNGLTINFYGGKDGIGHRIFSHGKHSKSGNNSDFVYSHTFRAVVPLKDFNANIARTDINYYLTHYKG